MSTVIKVEHLSKSYRLGTISTGSLHKDLQSTWARLRGKEDPNRRIDQGEITGSRKDLFLALNDVSFGVKQGEVLGIIGRNGAGKSTLLKILSRITAPTAGTVKIRGRIASLLEVGTGFHPELTGRENIFLNGAILGMTRREIDRKFDEIVNFAEIEQFIDTPVKRYSSGMYVRLAFAVAAHLEPEILIIDEVLAVGDVQFQKKCLGKMGEVGREGRTVLFVSHQLPAMSALCTQGLWLGSGKICSAGTIHTVIHDYTTAHNQSSTEIVYSEYARGPGDEYAELISAKITNSHGKTQQTFQRSESVHIIMEYNIKRPEQLRLVPNFHVKTYENAYIFVSNAPDIHVLDSGIYRAECIIPPNFLNDEIFIVEVAVTAYGLSSFNTCFYESNSLQFSISDDPTQPSNDRYNFGGKMPGVIRPKLQWSVQRI
ncbi:MAG: ABC transporter ATP-binding protein [Spirochaetes bacterium]|nr:ABC transporter ATP-binding protein [Spirochaetota bacterium]